MQAQGWKKRNSSTLLTLKPGPALAGIKVPTANSVASTKANFFITFYFFSLNKSRQNQFMVLGKRSVSTKSVSPFTLFT